MRSLLRMGTALAGAALLCTSASALAAGRPHDLAATRAYLRIVGAQQRVESSHLGTAVAAIEALAHRIAGECPGALAYAPRDLAYEEVGETLEYALPIAFDDALVTQAQALQQARALDALSWSSTRLTRLVRGRAGQERAFATHAPPNPCPEIAAWRASSYTALPATITQFVAQMRASEPEIPIGPREEPPEKVIARLLASYERPAQRRLAQSILDLEQRISKRFEFADRGAARGLAAALGVVTP